MGNFKIGEKVVCVAISDIEINTNQKAPHPKKNDIVTISDIAVDGWLSFEEMPSCLEYEPYNYRKLDYEFAENLLAEISEAMKSETIKN